MNKLKQANLPLYKFGPLLSLLYTVSNFYVFAFMLNFWNNFDAFTLLFSFSHLFVPAYTVALSYYESSFAQFIIYYFSSIVTTLASALLALETGLTLLGLFAQSQSSQSPTMTLFSGTFVSNMTVILVPFAGMVMFLYYEIVRYEKEVKPQDTRLYKETNH